MTFVYGTFVIASIALLLVCGRVTHELRAMVDRARWDADHDGLARITELIGHGVRFAVDDMGAGYSGLRQITTVRPAI